MSTWHSKILTPEQTSLLPAIESFAIDFGLVGGTAIALHIGHRESIDFDLFTKNPAYDFDVAKLRQKFKRNAVMNEVFVQEKPEFTFMAGPVKITFYHFEYQISYADYFGKIPMPSLLTLAAMKAFAMGQRNKWKDYVDMYFIMREFHTLAEIVHEAERLFKSEFNAKLFRQQLSYFDDINYAEVVMFKQGFEVPDDEIKRALTEYSLA